MLHFIVNPRSLRGKTKNLLQRIRARCQEQGVDFIIHQTVNKGDATAYAREITAQKGETVVAIGGDGMLNDVLSGLQNVEDTAFGLIPAGTGNDFATSANLPRGEKALELILTSQPKDTDFLQFFDGKRSMNIAGVGIDVDILKRCARARVFRGRSKYFVALLGALWKYKGDTLKFEVNGETFERKTMIAALCNGKELGGGIPLCPPAEIDDGKLELVIVDFPKRRKLLGALVKLMKGKLFDLPFAHRIPCERATVTPLAPCVAQYDGELYETASLGGEIVSGKLKMFRG